MSNPTAHLGSAYPSCQRCPHCCYVSCAPLALPTARPSSPLRRPCSPPRWPCWACWHSPTLTEWAWNSSGR
eukprot:333996-Pelagomonas_calceolata.AAC.4